MAIKFGVSQANKPTPSKINLYVRIYTVTASTFLGWMPTTNLIESHAAGNISGILGLSLLLANGIAPLFGVQLNDNAKVSQEDVTAMDNPEKKDP